MLNWNLFNFTYIYWRIPILPGPCSFFYWAVVLVYGSWILPRFDAPPTLHLRFPDLRCERPQVWNGSASSLWVMYYVCCMQTLMGKSPADLFYGLVDENSGVRRVRHNFPGHWGSEDDNGTTHRPRPNQCFRKEVITSSGQYKYRDSVKLRWFPLSNTSLPNRVQCDASALNIQKETVISLRRQFWCRESSLL